MTPNLINIIIPASDASPAATYTFVTRGFKAPRQPRDMGSDVVHNQNGKFKYIYDSGPGFLEWEPFEILCDDKFQNIIGARSATQMALLTQAWEYSDVFQVGTPEGIYSVYWAENPFEKRFRQFPRSVGDKIDYEVTIQLQEA